MRHAQKLIRGVTLPLMALSSLENQSASKCAMEMYAWGVMIILAVKRAEVSSATEKHFEGGSQWQFSCEVVGEVV